MSGTMGRRPLYRVERAVIVGSHFACILVSVVQLPLATRMDSKPRGQRTCGIGRAFFVAASRITPFQTQSRALENPRRTLGLHYDLDDWKPLLRACMTLEILLSNKRSFRSPFCSVTKPSRVSVKLKRWVCTIPLIILVAPEVRVMER